MLINYINEVFHTPSKSRSPITKADINHITFNAVQKNILNFIDNFLYHHKFMTSHKDSGRIWVELFGMMIGKDKMTFRPSIGYNLSSSGETIEITIYFCLNSYIIKHNSFELSDDISEFIDLLDELEKALNSAFGINIYIKCTQIEPSYLMFNNLDNDYEISLDDSDLLSEDSPIYDFSCVRRIHTDMNKDLNANVEYVKSQMRYCICDFPSMDVNEDNYDEEGMSPLVLGLSGSLTFEKFNDFLNKRVTDVFDKKVCLCTDCTDKGKSLKTDGKVSSRMNICGIYSEISDNLPCTSTHHKNMLNIVNSICNCPNPYIIYEWCHTKFAIGNNYSDLSKILGKIITAYTLRQIDRESFKYRDECAIMYFPKKNEVCLFNDNNFNFVNVKPLKEIFDKHINEAFKMPSKCVRPSDGSLTIARKDIRKITSNTTQKLITDFIVDY